MKAYTLLADEADKLRTAWEAALLEATQQKERADRLEGERDQLRREAEMAERDSLELLDNTRQALLRCFPEMDRLRIAMLHRNAHEGEWSVPTLAEHVATRLGAAHTPTEEKPSEVVAARMEELKRQRDEAREEVAQLREELGLYRKYGGTPVRYAVEDELDRLHPYSPEQRSSR